MRKFKKGDKVRVIKDGHNFKNIISTVISVSRFKFMDANIFVDTPGFQSQFYSPNELEFITNKTQLFSDEDLEKMIKWFIKDNSISWTDFLDERNTISVLTDFYNFINAEPK